MSVTLEQNAYDNQLLALDAYESINALNAMLAHTAPYDIVQDYSDHTDDYTVDTLSDDDEIDRINSSGLIIVSELAEPTTAHRALDGLLTLEKIRLDDAGLRPYLSSPGDEFDTNGIDYVDKIFAEADTLASIKAARLLCSRASSEAGAKNFVSHFAEIVDASNPDNKNGFEKTLAKQLSDDLCESIGNVVPEYNHEVSPRLDAFMTGLGYNAREVSQLRTAWQHGNRSMQVSKWAEANAKIILGLEQMEPGLAHKITTVHNIRNFARYKPDTLAKMHRNTIANPSRPYILAFISEADHNGAFCQPKKTDQFLEGLDERGIGYQEYEASSRSDVLMGMSMARVRSDQFGPIVKDIVFKMHGEPYEMQLSYGQEGSLLSTDTQLLKFVAPALCEDAKILFESCSTGAYEDGIASSFSKAAERIAIAPTIPTSSRISVKRRYGGSYANVSYRHPGKDQNSLSLGYGMLAGAIGAGADMAVTHNANVEYTIADAATILAIAPALGSVVFAGMMMRYRLKNERLKRVFVPE